jgi:indole-3-glycerol phosphate synthase
METLILTCLQAQLIATRVYKADMSKETRNDLIWEIKQISPKECRIDAKAD